MFIEVLKTHLQREKFDMFLILEQVSEFRGLSLQYTREEILLENKQD